MSAGTSNKIAKGLCKAFKGTVFTKTGRCIKHGIENFIEGLSVERTPYKETFYVWSFINPVWIRRPLDTLGYSERVARGRYFIGSAEQVTEQIISEVKNNTLHLARISGPETTAFQFIEAMFSESLQADNYIGLRGQEKAFDLGISLALDRKLEKSRETLEAFLTFSRRSQHYYRLCARAIVASLCAKDQNYLDVISDMREQSKLFFPFDLRKDE